MGNAAFGALVAKLRKNNNSAEEFTQKTLGERAKISTRNVSRIEQGQVVNLYSYLSKLAEAFQLTELEKVEFYATAGYVYVPEPKKEDRAFLRRLLERFTHPASVRTPLWDFVAFNRYHAVLFGYTQEDLMRMDQGLGPNLLRVLFDPEFQEHHYGGRAAEWGSLSLTVAAWKFRIASFKYQHTKRYQQIVDGVGKYRGFGLAWHGSLTIDEHWEGDVSARQPTVHVHHPAFGRMEFYTLNVPQRDLTEELNVTVYVPVASSADAYDKLRKQVTDNAVYFFREQPVE